MGAQVNRCYRYALLPSIPLFAKRTTGSETCDIDSLDTVGGGDWALSKNEAFREQLGQKTANGKLTARVAESWRRTHEDASEAIGLDPVREPGELGVSQDLGPAIQVEPGLRCKVR